MCEDKKVPERYANHGATREEVTRKCYVKLLAVCIYEDG